MSLDSIIKRRSIRSFTDEQVSAEHIHSLIEAALRAPSSMGHRPWHFVVVTDKKMLAELASAKPHGGSFLKNAPLGIAICADPLKSDVWVEDASIAAVFIQLAAESLDLGSCWIQLRNRMHDEHTPAGRFAANVLGLPDGLEVECIIAAGHPAERKPSRSREELLWDRVYSNRYGASFDQGD
jgi:nitroreductase